MNNYNPYGGYNYPQFSNQNNGMNWVQGEAGANAFAVAPNQLAVLFDSTRSVFYIKTVDQYGKPNPLEIYDYVKHAEPVQNQPDMSQYVTKAELQELLSKKDEKK